MKKKAAQIILLSMLLWACYALFVQWKAVSNNENAKGALDKDYFKGKTIEWIVPFKEGGGGDTWARFNATYLSRYLPGNPAVIIVNIPGGGSIKGANLFAKRVKPDGLMVLGTSGSTQIPYLLDDPRVQYDYEDYVPLMCYPTGGVVYVSSELGIKDIGGISIIQNEPLIFASQGPTSLDLVPNIAFDLLKMNVRNVFGFRGRGAARLSFERGELKIDYQTSSAYLKNVTPLIKMGQAVPLWSWGVIDSTGTLVRDPSFPDLPHYGEVYEKVNGKKGAGIAYESWFTVMAAGFGGMKLMLVPKETPQAIIDIYQNAIINMKKDPEYIAKKELAIGYYEQVVGKKAKTIFKLATHIKKENKEWCKEFLRKKYHLNI